jgi:hypothetical protein
VVEIPIKGWIRWRLEKQYERHGSEAIPLAPSILKSLKNSIVVRPHFLPKSSKNRVLVGLLVLPPTSNALDPITVILSGVSQYIKGTHVASYLGVGKVPVRIGFDHMHLPFSSTTTQKKKLTHVEYMYSVQPKRTSVSSK